MYWREDQSIMFRKLKSWGILHILCLLLCISVIFYNIGRLISSYFLASRQTHKLIACWIPFIHTDFVLKTKLLSKYFPPSVTTECNLTSPIPHIQLWWHCHPLIRVLGQFLKWLTTWVRFFYVAVPSFISHTP